MDHRAGNQVDTDHAQGEDTLNGNEWISSITREMLHQIGRVDFFLLTEVIAMVSLTWRRFENCETALGHSAYVGAHSENESWNCRSANSIDRS